MKLHHNPLLLNTATALIMSSTFYFDVLLAEPLQDGISSKQMVEPRPQPFSMHDIDKDGFLSRDEYRLFVEHIDHHRQTTGRPIPRFSSPLRFENIDSNGDGRITEDEMTSALNKRLQKHRRYRYHGGRW